MGWRGGFVTKYNSNSRMSFLQYDSYAVYVSEKEEENYNFSIGTRIKGVVKCVQCCSDHKTRIEKSKKSYTRNEQLINLIAMIKMIFLCIINIMQTLGFWC